MEFFRKVVFVTGGAQGIGKCILEEFHREEAIVAVIDTQDRPKDCVANLYYKGDLAVVKTLIDRAYEYVYNRLPRKTKESLI